MKSNPRDRIVHAQRYTDAPLEAQLDRFLRTGRYESARNLCERWLVQDPSSHWIRCRLASCHRNMGETRRAIRELHRALELQPKCPLALWEMGLCYEILSDYAKAIRNYRAIVRQGAVSIANGPCGEGRRWSRGIVADSMYAIATCYRAAGNIRSARRWITRCALLRKRGVSTMVSGPTFKRVHDSLASPASGAGELKGPH